MSRSRKKTWKHKVKDKWFHNYANRRLRRRQIFINENDDDKNIVLNNKSFRKYSEMYNIVDQSWQWTVEDLIFFELPLYKGYNK